MESNPSKNSKSSISSHRPSMKMRNDNMHKGKPSWNCGSSDNISDLTSFIENDFCFENLRLRSTLNNKNLASKEKTSAPKLLSQSKKITKETPNRNNMEVNCISQKNDIENSANNSAKFNIKRNLLKVMKEKNVADNKEKLSMRSKNGR